MNGLGAVSVALICAIGAVIWWPGKARLRRRMTLRRNVTWRRFIWDLHGVLGFWSFLLVLMWAATDIYFAFPGPFQAAADYR